MRGSDQVRRGAGNVAAVSSLLVGEALRTVMIEREGVRAMQRIGFGDTCKAARNIRRRMWGQGIFWCSRATSFKLGTAIADWLAVLFLHMERIPFVFMHAPYIIINYSNFKT